MIKSFSGRVVFCFAVPEPYLLTLAKTDYLSIQVTKSAKRRTMSLFCLSTFSDLSHGTFNSHCSV